MRIGVGLPTRADALPAGALLAWAEAADRGPYSSLAAMDRVVYPAHEPLTALAAVAGVTRRIGLLASVVIVPTRETTLLARQAASIDALSGGRFSLSLGVGSGATTTSPRVRRSSVAAAASTSSCRCCSGCWRAGRWTTWWGRSGCRRFGRAVRSC